MVVELSSKIEEVLPFVVMVVMEGCTIGLTILAKTNMSNGLSPFVFVVYTNAIATLLLFPFSMFFRWGQRVEQPLFTFPLFSRLCFLGFTGKTKLQWRSSSFQYKVIGSMITMVGALVVEFYKGPFFRQDSSNTPSKQHLFVFYSTPDHWVLGGFLLAASFLCVSVWNIIQLGTMKQYPQLQVKKVASLYGLAGTIQCAIFSFIVVRDFNAWKLNFNFDLPPILVTAIFGSVVRSSVQICFGRNRGPFYVPLFQPFRVFWACFSGITFFANSLHYGSVIGTIICRMGFYTVMCGQIKENEEPQEEIDVEKSHLSDEKVPLLQENEQV